VSGIGYKRLAFGLALVAVIEMVVIWVVAWHDTHAAWDVRDARIAVRRIENNRQVALNGTLQQAIAALDDVAACYTPWKWHRADLHLGEFVEERRAAAIRAILEDLRKKTGKDFGDSPQQWIDALKDKASTSD